MERCDAQRCAKVPTLTYKEGFAPWESITKLSDTLSAPSASTWIPAFAGMAQKSDCYSRGSGNMVLRDTTEFC